MSEMFNMDTKGKIATALVFMVMGFMLSVQYKATELSKTTVRDARVEDLSERLKAVQGENQQLLKEIEELKMHAGKQLSESELQRLQLISGIAAVEGNGVEILLDDSKIEKKQNANPNLYIIHDEDLLRVLNELRSAGAEAISINDQRIVAMSEVRCAGPTVSVNNVRSAPPYLIKAIGNPKTLDSALRIRGGVVETFEFWGIQVNVKQSNKVYIPAFKGVRTYENSTIVAEKAEGKKK